MAILTATTGTITIEFAKTRTDVVAVYLGEGRAPVDRLMLSMGVALTPFPTGSGGPAGPVDAAPPEVGNFDPPADAPISRGTILNFDVTDDTGIASVFIGASFEGVNRSEVVFAGQVFGPLYASSTRTPIAGGYRFAVRRVGGWPAGLNPTLSIEAVDTAGKVTP